jgi:hypothetical protein
MIQTVVRTTHIQDMTRLEHQEELIATLLEELITIVAGALIPVVLMDLMAAVVLIVSRNLTRNYC